MFNLTKENKKRDFPLKKVPIYYDFLTPIWNIRFFLEFRVAVLETFVIVGAFSADEFRARARRNQNSLANMRLLHVYGDGDFFQVHADERSADIEPGICLDMLDGDRMLEGAVAGGCKGASGLGLRNHIHDFGIGDCLALDDDGAVQVLATLRRDVDVEWLEYGREPFKNRLADFGYGMATDIVTQRRARAATDNYNLARREVSLFHKFLSGVHRVVTNLFNNVLVFNFVCNASHVLPI